MKLNNRYIVTKASDDGTFEIGDHISLTEAGSIICIEAQGWIDACDVPEATIGMETEIDIKWIEKERTKLLSKLKELEE